MVFGVFTKTVDRYLPFTEKMNEKKDLRQEKVKRLLIVGGALLGVILVLFFFVPRPAAPQLAPAAELKLEEAIRKDGLFYTAASTEPFTGNVIEHYESGTMKSRTGVRDGMLHGLSEGWYSNGQLQVSETFQDGVSHGIRTKWREDGTKLSEGEIVQGAFEGVFRKWHQNGQLEQEIPMKKGQAHGVSQSWYENGDLKAKAVMEEGQIRDQQFFDSESLPEASAPSN